MTKWKIWRLARYTEAALFVVLMGAVGAGFALHHLETSTLLGTVAAASVCALAAMWVTIGFVALELHARAATTRK